MVIDKGFMHESKIKDLALECPKYSGFNHLAIFLKWSYHKGILSDDLFSIEPGIKKALEKDEDIREIIATSQYMHGNITDFHFKDEFKPFVYEFYKFNGHGYPSCVDDYAKKYFGEEKYYSSEFKNEAYLFVPFTKDYYDGLSKYIDKAWENRNPKLKNESIGFEKLDYLYEKMKEKYKEPIVSFLLSNEKTTIFDSKVGGYPYWPKGKEKEYPTDENGQKLYLLAQINFSDIEFERLPSEGLLQFFVSGEGDLGIYEDDNHKVVFHEKIDTTVTEQDVKDMGIHCNMDIEEDKEAWFPTQKSFRLCPRLAEEECNPDNENYDDDARDILVEKYGLDIKSEWLSDYLCKEDYRYLCNKYSLPNHKMFGLPFFCQSDPRECDSKYDTLLFQLDSDFDGEFDLMFGDSGVCNFFINHEDLKRHDFSDVYAYMDCY